MFRLCHKLLDVLEQLSLYSIKLYIGIVKSSSEASFNRDLLILVIQLISWTPPAMLVIVTLTSIYELLKSHKRHLKKLVVNSIDFEFIYLETNLSFILIHFVVIDLVGKLNFWFKKFDTFLFYFLYILFTQNLITLRLLLEENQYQYILKTEMHYCLYYYHESPWH